MPPCPSCGTSCHRLHAGSPAGGTRASASAHAHGSGDNRLRRRALSLIERLSPRRARSASFDERSRRLSDDLLRVKRGTLAVASRFASRDHADQSLDRGAGYPVGRARDGIHVERLAPRLHRSSRHRARSSTTPVRFPMDPAESPHCRMQCPIHVAASPRQRYAFSHRVLDRVNRGVWCADLSCAHRSSCCRLISPHRRIVSS
jgi:hypothetical protein